MDEQRLHDDVGDGHARVERPIGVLEDDLNVAAPRAQRLRGQGDEIVAEEFDAARGRLDQAEQHAADRRLAAAGFADQAERLAQGDIETDIVDRAQQGDRPLEHDAAAHREVLGQAFDAQERVHGVPSSARRMQAAS
jgi:hypothetical protein